MPRDLFHVPRRHRLARLIALGVAGALLLSACSVRKQYGVNTTVVSPKGTCDSSRIVEVGAALDLSGPQASLGREYLAGIRLAVEQVNQSGGVLKNHRCLELLYKNTEDNAKIADKAVLDLVNNEVVAFLFAPFDASEVTFSGADLGLAGVPTVSVSSLDITTRTKPYPQLFPVTPPESVLAHAAISYARSRHWTSVAAVGENNPAGAEGVADFSADAAKAGLSMTGAAHGADIQSELQTLQGGNPQGLFVAGDDLGVGAILSARRSSGWKVPVVAAPVAADAAVVGELGSAGAAGVSVIAPTALVVSGANGTPSDPTMVAFLSTMRRQVGASAFSGSMVPYAEAYDGIELLAYVGTSIDSIRPGDIRTFIENANYQGLLANYNYTSGAHLGVGTSQLKVVALASLSGGLFHS